MKIGILGAGAMGSLVGAHIKTGGGEVWLVDVFEEHMRAVREKGLTMELESETAPRTVFFDGAVARGDEVGPCDAVIVLVKCVDTDRAIETNRALFGKDTIVITLQNGLGNGEALLRHFDADHAGIGLLKASANIIGPGRILGSPRFPNSPKGVYFTPIGAGTPFRQAYGELEKLLCAGGMPAECSDRTEEYIWDKLCTNVMYNGIAALTQIANEYSGGHEDGWLLMRELARETCEVGRAAGFDMQLENYWRERTGEQPGRRSATLHFVSAVFDSFQKRKTEIDFLNGAVVREGKKHGIATPYNETVWRLVRVMQDNYDNKYKPREE